jgi:carboxyl-terminal processing protease
VVAVLVDRGTASSGEAVAISFQGSPYAKSFGTPTHEQSTSNEGFLLQDGANLVLTTGVEADRTGRIYLDGVRPDVELPEETGPPAPGTIDPITKAAAAWMKTLVTHHEACSSWP